MANKKEFLVSFIKEGSNQPRSLTVMAVNVVGAIDEMVSAADVSSTNSITAFEILEKIEKGQWRRAAIKLSDKEQAEMNKKKREATPPPTSSPKKEEITLATSEVTEDQYEPYVLVYEEDLPQTKQE